MAWENQRLCKVYWLLRQSYERNTLKTKGLLLNGDYVNIGTGKDALSSFSEQEEIIFTIKWLEKASNSQHGFLSLIINMTQICCRCVNLVLTVIQNY